MNAGTKTTGRLFYGARPPAAEPDPLEEQRLERHLLKFSLYSAFFFAGLGLVWGKLIRSQLLIFDGAYALAGMVTACLYVYASKVISAGDDEKFPFGRSQIEPLVIIIKAVAILAVCAFAFSKAVGSILAGGREINVLSAMVYYLIGIAGCLGNWIYIGRKRKKSRLSGLTGSEIRQWRSDTLLSAGMVIGLLLAHLSRGTEHAAWVRYADPGLVIVAVFLVAAAPIVALAGGIRDMLLMAPGGDVYRVSRQALGEIAKERGFDGFVLRIGKAGRIYFYEIGFVSRQPGDTRSIGELDSIRREVEERLRGFYDNPIALGVSFMRDEKWG